MNKPQCMTIFIIGDIGGQLKVFNRILKKIGVKSNYKLPDDIKVIQVGDLTRASPKFLSQNTIILETIKNIINANPSRWIQLYGNHESAALGGPKKSDWDIEKSYDSKCLYLLDNLWKDKKIKLAHTFSLNNKDYLVTHAGITYHRWKSLGQPQAYKAEKIINKDCGKDFSKISKAGILVENETVLTADTQWAEVNKELYLPWIKNSEMPFSQIHGHASPYNWEKNDWWEDASNIIKKRTILIKNSRQTINFPGNNSHFFLSIDWNLGNNITSQIWPLVNIKGNMYHE